MKTRGFVFVSLLAAVVCVTAAATGQQRKADPSRVSPNAEAHQRIGKTEVHITYGAPASRGREVWGKLVPYGQVWRTGANEATTIRFSTDVRLEGQSLKAGTYALFTIPGEQEWTVIFNKEANQWGAFSYRQSEDALRVTVKPAAAAQTEQMTISFEPDGANAARVVLRWEKLRVAFRVEGAA